MTTAPLAPLQYPPRQVEAAEAMVRNFCGWHIAPSKTEEVTLDGPGGVTLILPSLRVTAITSIVEDGVTLPESAYTWSQGGVVKRVEGRWSEKHQAIEVTMTHGYDRCPVDIEWELDRLAKAPNAAPAGIVKGQVGQVSVTYGEQIINASVLAPYQLVAR